VILLTDYTDGVPLYTYSRLKQWSTKQQLQNWARQFGT